MVIKKNSQYSLKLTESKRLYDIPEQLHHLLVV